MDLHPSTIWQSWLFLLFLLYSFCWIDFNCSFVWAASSLDEALRFDLSTANFLNKSCQTSNDCINEITNSEDVPFRKSKVLIPFSYCDVLHNRCTCISGYRPSNFNGTSLFSCIRNTISENNSNNNNGDDDDDLVGILSETNNKNNGEKLSNWTILAKNTKGNISRSNNKNRSDNYNVFPNPMIPILVVLITMFICMCIVLQLFAKARFRNANTSIFVNPQKLELAKAHERRMSQLSQLSCVPGGQAARIPRTLCPYLKGHHHHHHHHHRHHHHGCHNSGLKQYQRLHGRSLPSIFGTRSARSSIGSATMAGVTSHRINIAAFIHATTTSLDHFSQSNNDTSDSSSIVIKAKSRANSIQSSKLF